MKLLARAPLWATVPLVLLLLGPPVWRSYASRSIGATLSGQFDVWIILQLVLYIMVAASVFLWLFPRLSLGRIDKRQFFLLGVIFALVYVLGLSLLVTPSFLASATFLGLFVIGVFAAVQAAVVFSRASFNDLFYFVRVSRWVVAGLAVVVYLSYFLDIGYSSRLDLSAGVRIMGERIAYMPAIGLYVYTISLFLLAVGREKRRWSFGFVLFALVIVFFTKTRAAYLLVIASTLLVGGYWVLQPERRFRASYMKYLVLTACVGTAVVLAVIFDDAIASMLTRGQGFDSSNFTTAGGRSIIMEWVVARANENVFGLGFVSGFRRYFTSVDIVTAWQMKRSGIDAADFGTAHSSYLEVLAGGGWMALMLYCFAILLCLIKAARIAVNKCTPRSESQLAVLCGTLLVIMQLHALVTSNYILPTHHEFAQVLWVAAMIVGLQMKQLGRNKASRSEGVSVG